MQPVSTAPVVLISLKTQAIVCLFLGFVAMIDFALRKAGVTVDDD
ncbi:MULTISPECIES: hypothetical protein [Rhizobium]|nr:hypothetical protein [Rhizobium leguminosarum]